MMVDSDSLTLTCGMCDAFSGVCLTCKLGYQIDINNNNNCSACTTNTAYSLNASPV